MKIVAVILSFVSIADCAGGASQRTEHLEKINQYSLEGERAHFAGFEKWRKGAEEVTKCGQLALVSIDGAEKCLNSLPPPETIFTKDKRQGETLSTYLERKEDEWAEKDCRWQTWRLARSVDEVQPIEAQCKRDLEFVRLHKPLTNLTPTKKLGACVDHEELSDPPKKP